MEGSSPRNSHIDLQLYDPLVLLIPPFAVLANLVKNYVETINRGQVPCLENAVQALAEIENAAAVREAVSHYEELMEKQMRLPTETVEELLELHAECEKVATGVFMARAFGDRITNFQRELVVCSLLWPVIL